MQYRRYGKTGLNISVITFGAMRVPYDADTATAKERDLAEQNAVACARRAMELGINHIDTARGYGTSEILTGLMLKELGRDKFHVSTKILADISFDEAKKQIDEALVKLDTDYIDIMDLHGINLPEHLEFVQKKNSSLYAVQEAIEEGKIGHLSFSSHADSELLVPVLETGLFSAVSLHHFWTMPKNFKTLEKAKEMDIGVLILSPTDKGGMLCNPTNELLEVCKPFSPVALTHRWMLTQDSISTITVGAAKPSEFDAHLEAIDKSDTLTDEEQKALKRWLDKEIEVLGDTRCTQCGKCMPCPQNVAIPVILRLRNLAKSFDMMEFCKMRYNLLEEAGHWFPGKKSDKCNDCGLCIPLCPENLKIPELLQDTHNLLMGKQRKRLWK